MNKYLKSIFVQFFAFTLLCPMSHTFLFKRHVSFAKKETRVSRKELQVINFSDRVVGNTITGVRSIRRREIKRLRQVSPTYCEQDAPRTV